VARREEEACRRNRLFSWLAAWHAETAKSMAAKRLALYLKNGGESLTVKQRRSEENQLL